MRNSTCRYCISVLLCWLLAGSSLFAQTGIRGVVTEPDSTHVVPLANVVLQSFNDTTQVLGATATDLQGRYSILGIRPGVYRVLVSCLGYQPLRQRIRLGMSGGATGKEVNLVLQPDTLSLSDVRIERARTKQEALKRVITFTSEELSTSRMSQELLTKVPGLELDPQSGKVTSVDHQGVVFLLNGVKTTQNQLKTIPTDKVRRVEYYDIPPIQYGLVGKVVNVITKELRNGLAWGFDVQHAFTTWFGNDNVYFAYNYGQHRFDLEYSLNLRQYRDNRFYSYKRYALEGVPILDSTYGTQPFGYRTHRASFKYAYVDTTRHTFQLTLRPGYDPSHRSSNSQALYRRGAKSLLLEDTYDDDTKTVTPALDLYYDRKLTDDSHLIAALTGTYFWTQRARASSRMFEETTLEDYTMELTNQKASSIAEIRYTHQLNAKAQLVVGYKNNYSYLRSDITNSGLGASNYNSQYLDHNVYLGLTGLYGSFIYDVSLTAHHLFNHSYSANFHQGMLAPRVVLGYLLDAHNTLRLALLREPILPSVTELSYNETQINQDILSSGNPDLKNGSQTSAFLMYIFNNSWLHLIVGPGYMYSQNSIFDNVRLDEVRHKYLYISENTPSMHTVMGYASLQLKPFSNDYLVLSAYAMPTWVYWPGAPAKRWQVYWPNNFSITGSYAGFSLNCHYVHPVYEFNAIDAQLTEQILDATLSYRWQNWRFSLACLWIAMPSHYASRTLYDQVPIQAKSENWIYDNKTMFTLGISYSFTRGEDNKFNRKVKNSDDVAPSY